MSNRGSAPVPEGAEEIGLFQIPADALERLGGVVYPDGARGWLSMFDHQAISYPSVVKVPHLPEQEASVYFAAEDAEAPDLNQPVRVRFEVFTSVVFRIKGPGPSYRDEFRLYRHWEEPDV